MRTHQLGTMNICATFHSNPSGSCWAILIRAKLMDRPTNYSADTAINRVCFALSRTHFCPHISHLKNITSARAYSRGQGDRESLISLPHPPSTEGWSLLCHQTISQPCHYYAVKVVSGCGVGVSNGSEVTICGTWYDRGCRSPSQVNGFLTESWRAEYGSLFDNCSSENNTCQGDCICHPKSLHVCRALYNCVLWKSVWNRCLWFPQSCTKDVLWVIWNVFTLVAITLCCDQFEF